MTTRTMQSASDAAPPNDSPTTPSFVGSVPWFSDDVCESPSRHAHARFKAPTTPSDATCWRWFCWMVACTMVALILVARLEWPTDTAEHGVKLHSFAYFVFCVVGGAISGLPHTL